MPTGESLRLYVAAMRPFAKLLCGNVTSAGLQVTLCDPMWHVSSRSGVATLRTATHSLLLTYFQTELHQKNVQQAQEMDITMHKRKQS